MRKIVAKSIAPAFAPATIDSAEEGIAADPARPSRFEFRCWPDDAGRIDQAFQNRLKFVGVEERLDIYLLPMAESCFLPKIRGGEKFEIKELVETDGPLERWKVILSESFPLAGASLAAIAGIFPRADRAPESFASARASVRALEKSATIIRARKLRRKFGAGLLSAEATRVVNHVTTRESLAFEATDPLAVLRAVEAFGLADCENLNYAAALKRYFGSDAGGDAGAHGAAFLP